MNCMFQRIGFVILLKHCVRNAVFRMKKYFLPKIKLLWRWLTRCCKADCYRYSGSAPQKTSCSFPGACVCKEYSLGQHDSMEECCDRRRCKGNDRDRKKLPWLETPYALCNDRTFLYSSNTWGVKKNHPIDNAYGCKIVAGNQVFTVKNMKIIVSYYIRKNHSVYLSHRKKKLSCAL